ncbi:hypothetical protein Pcinc_015566 [Petrolisthes cinctipes]|uniref:Uncharacterized protein n=1 Tax=Petrolisthes cinctipes TaxID=88211 RepID=A0AAE1KQC6_PETCI|nr:hypothetical protein Pcinc_020099 [Petrolisthes cinctipes]KAK3879923.1 hypothetical protein Pcinc_015566 [Petrolisthes cinctipes]
MYILDNLDAAVDPEGGRGGGDDLTGDQDEEGNEVHQRPNEPEEGAGGGPEEEGAVELPPRPILPHGDYFYHNLDSGNNHHHPERLN